MTSGGVRIAGKGKKIGRPITVKDNVTLTIRLDEATQKKLEQLTDSKHWNCTKSEAIRRAIEEEASM